MTLRLANITKSLLQNDIPQDNTSSTPTALPPLYSLHDNRPLSFVPQNYMNTLATTEHTSHGSNFPCSPVYDITLHQPKIDDT